MGFTILVYLKKNCSIHHSYKRQNFSISKSPPHTATASVKKFRCVLMNLSETIKLSFEEYVSGIIIQAGGR